MAGAVSGVTPIIGVKLRTASEKRCAAFASPVDDAKSARALAMLSGKHQRQYSPGSIRNSSA